MMKSNKRLLALLTVLIISANLLAGCGQTAKPAETSSQSIEQSSESVVSEETEKAETPTTREITDMAGRKVTIPAAEQIESAYSTNPISAIFLYMVNPDKLLGWNYELNDIEKSIILEKYHNLPNFGMGDAVNYEAVIAAKPTIALHCTNIKDSTAADCDELEEKLGVPVIAVDSDLKNSVAAFRFIGELLGEEDRCEKLAAYAEKTFADIEKLADIPEEERVRVYYGNGEDSLETAPKGSKHAQILDAINAANVADLEMGEGSRVQISAEQLLSWDPDIIVVNGEPKANMSGSSAAEAILNNPDFESLKAVQEGKVYGTPNAPFSWVDRPQGPNRLIGMRWFSALFYPDIIQCDINEEVHIFFDLFYHVDLNEEQMNHLLKGTL